MKIVVTGATGFIGGWTLRELKLRGHEVIGVSRTTENRADGVIKVSPSEKLPQADVIIHLGERNIRSEANELGELHTIELLTEFERIKDAGYSRAVYASSAAVYSDLGPHRPKTIRDIAEVQDGYTRGKLQMEKSFLEWNENTTIARIGNTYGPGMSESTVLASILRQLKDSKRLEINLHSVQPIRDYIWVGDVASALVVMAESSVQGIYNVGTGMETSVADLANQAAVVVNRSGISLKAPECSSESYLVLDIKETLRDFAWEPKVTLAQGLKRTLGDRKK